MKLTEPITATIEKHLVLQFTLPGVVAESVSGLAGPGNRQLESPHFREENWSLKVTLTTARQTAATLRSLADAIDRASASEVLT